MARRAENEILYDTMNTFLNNCLLSDKSLMWPDKSYWTLDNLLFLNKHVIEAPLLGRELSFEEKLEKQMDGASDAEWAIICDIYFVYFLPSSYMKMEKIQKDICWAASKVSIEAPDATHPIWKSQEHGFTRTSMRYHTKYGQFWFIILFAIYLKKHESPNSVLKKSIVMQQAMDMVLENIPAKADRAYDMRHAMLYMAFPDEYERIISTRDKQLIVDKYRNSIADALPTDLDESLLIIRSKLGEKLDKPDRKFDFYIDLKDEWRPGTSTSPGTVTVDTDKGVITVPAGDSAEESPMETSKDISAHTEIQWLLLKLGNDMGLDLWVAKNDRGKEIKGQRFTDLPRLKKALPLTFDDITNKTIELIDVLWLKQSNILAAFEIESTTSIYSGILRMADLIAMQPNINIPLYIVAPDDRRAKVYSEVNRPVFSSLSTPMNEICKYISFSSLRNCIGKAGSMIKYLKPEFLDDIAETCELYQDE
jgi:hypothetical protein